jgi:hypothetical protein
MSDSACFTSVDSDSMRFIPSVSTRTSPFVFRYFHWNSEPFLPESSDLPVTFDGFGIGRFVTQW